MNSQNRIAFIAFISIPFLIAGKGFAAPIDADKIQQLEYSDTLIQNNKFGIQSTLSWGLYVIMIVGICVLAYFTTRWLSQYHRNAFIKSKYLEVIDTLTLSGENRIYIIRTPQGIIMIGVNQRQMSILQRFDDSEADIINGVEAGFEGSGTFASHLGDILGGDNIISDENNGDHI